MRRKRFMSIVLIAALLGTMLLAGCGDKKKADKPVATTTDIKQLVNDYSTDKLQAKSASITSEQLIVTAEDDRKTTYDLPDDEFFVSIAPYENQTHPCEIHSLTGCQGEMANETFNVTVSDQDGNVVVEGDYQSLDNGFIDLWLPRDQKWNVKIEHEGKVSEAEISTFSGDNTCISNMQLS
ncbi:CueP family metal-binding protein [Paenibacillus sp. DYY-L-2]|uniref:CueP family metal-binding protein n=1 Tax=Paenibacillus sp. DYY-L-2 TaxID=3447013 RepID=UPI003F5095BE